MKCKSLAVDFAACLLLGVVYPEALAADDAVVRLAITEAGEVKAAGPEFKVKPNETVNLKLEYVGRNLARSKGWSGASTWMKIVLIWLDVDGKDIDVARAAQYRAAEIVDPLASVDE